MTSSDIASVETTKRVYRTWRERFVVPLLVGVLVFGGIALFPAVIASDSLVIDGIFIVTYLLVALAAAVKFSYMIRITVFLAGTYAIGIGELVSLGIIGDGLFFFLALVVFATMLISTRAGIIAIAAGVLAFIVFGWLMLGAGMSTLNPAAAPADIGDWISAGAALIMFGAAVIIGVGQLEREFSGAQEQISTTLNALRDERNNFENRVKQRTLQLRRINEVERAVSAILDVNELLPLAARFIQNEFGFYHTAIYLMDSTGQWAELKEALGETGKLLKDRKHRVNVNGKGIIAQVIRAKTGQILQGAAQIRQESPLLPYTRAMIALPLVVGDTVLGALEMHSSKEGDILPQDVDAFQNMANGISISIENSRLFQEAQRSVMEMRATQRQYLENAWNSLASERPLQYALGDVDLSDRNLVESPLSLRGQTIGHILAAGDAEWTAEQKDLIESIAAQASLALENARLVEDSRQTASQERLVNEIISKIWASASIDGVLQTAVRELGRSLEASEVEIEISMEGSDDE
jgi:GAF domain-containing protein